MTNPLTDNNFDLLAYPLLLAMGFPAASARAGTDGPAEVVIRCWLVGGRGLDFSRNVKTPSHVLANRG